MLVYVGVFVMVIVGWLVLLCLYEFGYVFIVWCFGDYDVVVCGYLMLDFCCYSYFMFLFGLLMLFIVLGGIGLLGVVVYVYIWFMMMVCCILVSLVGLMVNLVLVMLLLVVIWLLFDLIYVVLWVGVVFLVFF